MGHRPVAALLLRCLISFVLWELSFSSWTLRLTLKSRTVWSGVYQGQKEGAWAGKKKLSSWMLGRTKFEATTEPETLARQALRNVPSALCLKRAFPLWGRFSSVPEMETLQREGHSQGIPWWSLEVWCRKWVSVAFTGAHPGPRLLWQPNKEKSDWGCEQGRGMDMGMGKHIQD